MSEPYVVDDLNEAVASRWRDLDPLLPALRDLPDGCQLVVSGANGRSAGGGISTILLHYAQLNPLLEPDGIPAAVDRLGDPPGRGAALRADEADAVGCGPA